MLDRLLSGELPRSRLLATGMLLVLAYLALAPFVTSSTRGLDVAANVCIYIVLVASYDLLIGYTGIVSFAHTMFFGIGAFGVSTAMVSIGTTWPALATGVFLAFVLSGLLALAIGLFSLRVRTTYFSMITLAASVAFGTVALQFPEWTGGSDGLSFGLPRMLTPGYVLGQVGSTRVTGRTLVYYLLFVGTVAAFLALLRVVGSPFGRVLQAIRENDFRAEALGYRVVTYRTLATVLAALGSTFAGILLALWERYTSPLTTLSLDIMLYVLLMAVIGGMGTLYGAVVGAVLFMVAQAYLQDLIGAAGRELSRLPLVGDYAQILFASERWLFWLGICFVLCVCLFPSGVVGELRRKR